MPAAHARSEACGAERPTDDWAGRAGWSSNDGCRLCDRDGGPMAARYVSGVLQCHRLTVYISMSASGVRVMSSRYTDRLTPSDCSLTFLGSDLDAVYVDVEKDPGDGGSRVLAPLLDAFAADGERGVRSGVRVDRWRTRSRMQTRVLGATGSPGTTNGSGAVDNGCIWMRMWGDLYAQTRHAYVLGILGSCGRSPKYSSLAAPV
ncbi:hypothetical protein BD413DRAFT_283321 [Trametes elegans]|nr:hypothetical protein BD413DRAFT_283321 [Trametes elegans]